MLLRVVSEQGPTIRRCICPGKHASWCSRKVQYMGNIPAAHRLSPVQILVQRSDHMYSSFQDEAEMYTIVRYDLLLINDRVTRAPNPCSARFEYICADWTQRDSPDIPGLHLKSLPTRGLRTWSWTRPSLLRCRHEFTGAHAVVPFGLLHPHINPFT